MDATPSATRRRARWRRDHSLRKFSPQRQAIVVRWLRLGAPLRTALAAAGLSYETAQRWLARAAEAETRAAQGERGTLEDLRCRRFARAVERALAEAELRDLARIDAAGAKAWQAAAWKLERRYPHRYSLPLLARTVAEELLSATATSSRVLTDSVRRAIASLYGVPEPTPEPAASQESAPS